MLPYPFLLLLRQAFADSLKAVAESGRGMNDVDLFPVPVELLHFLDSPSATTTNPEVFRAQAYKKTYADAESVASRIHYLQVDLNLILSSYTYFVAVVSYLFLYFFHI